MALFATRLLVVIVAVAALTITATGGTGRPIRAGGTAAAALLTLALRPWTTRLARRTGWLRFATVTFGGRLKAGHDHPRQTLVSHSLNRLEHADLIATDQRDRLTLGPGPTGAANAVDIIFGHLRHLVIDHMGQLSDVDTAGGNIGSHQCADLAILELGQRLDARRLALVTVDGHGRNAVIIELFGQAVGAMLGLGKNQHLLPVVVANDV